MNMSNKAVFLDRDGVLNKSIFDEKRKVFRAPYSISEVKILPKVIESLKKLYNMGYSLYVVTNQPDFVKGWIDEESLKNVKQYISETLLKNGINIQYEYYCWHHPNFCPCECRKPSPYFLLQANKNYNIDLSKSWMVGDRDTDVMCGKNAGTRTIFIGNEKSKLSDFTAKNLEEAVEIIRFCENIRKKIEDI